MRLEKIFRNAIFEAIEAAGLDPGEFDLELGETDEAEARITHRWSESYLILSGSWGAWAGSYVVGDSPPWPYTAVIWPNIEERVRDWTAQVKRDLETPDLWAELGRRREMLARTPDEVGNTKFTPDEQTEIVALLEEIKEQVKSAHSLSAAELTALEAGFDELKSAVGRLGRFDFKNVVVGVLAGWLLASLLPPDVVNDILMMVLHGLQHLVFGNGGIQPTPELPPPPPQPV